MNKFALSFLLNFVLGTTGLVGTSHAQSEFEVPPGFQMDKVHRAFKGTNTEFDWYRISNSSVALFIYDMDQTKGFASKVKKHYNRNLEKYSAQLAEYGKIIPKFNAWLLASGVDALDRSLKECPVQFVIDPMVDLTETNALFNYAQLEHHQKPDWWVEVWMEPVSDVDFLLGYPPVIIHELGHFIFRSFLESGELIPANHSYLSFTLGPLDEAFGDAVSYEFTGQPLVGKRFDYSKKENVEFRRALTSTAADRLSVRQGTWNYKNGDPHVKGEPFRDVLIEISQQYGHAFLFQAMKEIQKELLRPGSPLLGSPLTNAEESLLFNQVIPKVLAQYPLR